MTLAALAASPEASAGDGGAALAVQLAEPGYATGGRWELAWGPATRGAQSLFAARDVSRPSRYAIAVGRREPVTFFSPIEEFDLALAPYPFTSPASPDVRISRGALLGLEALQVATAPLADRLSGERRAASLVDFLASLGAGGDSAGPVAIQVAGHGLGGCLATVLAAWLGDRVAGGRRQRLPLQVTAQSFGAPTAGNDAFADHIDASLGRSAVRVFSTRDPVALLWHDPWHIVTSQVPCAVPSAVLQRISALAAHVRDASYTPATNAVPLPAGAGAEGEFDEQVAYEHAPSRYLALLGAPPLRRMSSSGDAASGARPAAVA